MAGKKKSGKPSGPQRYVILPLQGLKNEGTLSLPRDAATTHTLAARPVLAAPSALARIDPPLLT